MEKNRTIPFRKAMALNWRGILIYWRLCPGLFFSKAVYAAVMGFTPYINIWLSAQLVGQLAGERNVSKIMALVAAIVISGFFVLLLSESIKHWASYEDAESWQNNDRIMIRKLLAMDFADMDSPRTHDLLAQITQNAGLGGWGLPMLPRYFERCLRSIISILCALSMTAGMFLKKVPDTAGALLVLNHPACVAAVVFFMLGTTLLASFFEGRAEKRRMDHADQARFGNRAFGFFGFEAASPERAVDMRIYNQQDISSHYFRKTDSFGLGSDVQRFISGMGGLLYALSASAAVSFRGFIYVFVCLKAWAGAFGVGLVAQYIGAVTALYTGVGELFQTVTRLRGNAVFLEITFSFLDIPNRMYQGSLTVEKRSDRKYEIEFRDVSFRYPSSEEYALRHVSFAFRVGERLAIVGENGSGKTTFIKLLCRLYDPTEGVILLNGIDIRKYDYREYMSVFAVVFQDFQLLSGSLMENVAAGRSYDTERVRECLVKAGFGERLETLPKGLKTCLHKDFDKEAVPFSGGERQKIALARALYKDAPFIILDEPTAALDPVAEQEVYEKFDEIAGGKTAVYISHRLSSCRFCDIIAVFDHGRIIQYGSHESLLLDEKGKYHELWYAQAQYYREEQERKKEMEDIVNDKIICRLL